MRLSVLGFSVVACVSCATVGTKFHEADVAKLKVCAATRRDAVALFGEPTQMGSEAGYFMMRWSYADDATLGDPKVESLRLLLDKSDRVVDVALNPSPKYVPVDRCTGAPPPVPASIPAPAN